MATGAKIGVCYGTVADNLPPPEEVISLYKDKNIQRMRLYNPNHRALQALRGSNIKVMLGVENEKLERISSDQEYANEWVKSNVLPYSNNVNFKYIAVGNELIRTGYQRFVAPAMQKIQNAIAGHDHGSLATKIEVSTAVHQTILTDTYPPSIASFHPDCVQDLKSIIAFLVEHNSPLLFNLYPYFSYTAAPQHIKLEYALFKSTSVVVTDEFNGCEYKNLFAASLDAVYSALEKLPNHNAGAIEVVVSETGWPSGGGKLGATVENAKAYNSNVIDFVSGGTPKRSGRPIETYLFAMFNENKKCIKRGNDQTERNFGLFYPDKCPVYNIRFN